jgi:ABC-type phosphate transport system substrate-binding protein
MNMGMGMRTGVQDCGHSVAGGKLDGTSKTVVSNPITALMRRSVIAVMGLVLALADATAGADVVAVVSSKSAITALSKAQIEDIFFGRATHLPAGLQAVPLDQAEGSSAREEFYARVASKSPAQMKAYWSKIIFTGRGQPPKEVPNGTALRKRLADDPTAIGYIDAGLVNDSIRVVFQGAAGP